MERQTMDWTGSLYRVMATSRTIPNHEGGMANQPPDEAEFAGFFRSHYAKLGKAIYLMSGNRSEAEDVAQEAFIKVYARWDRVRVMESPDGYLYQVAINLYRRSRLATSSRTIPLAAVASGSIDDDTSSVDARVDLLRIVRRLPLEQREALVMVEWLGLDANAAAQVLGIAPASVRGRIFRARRTLRSVSRNEQGG
jgi:RNA polymerase sigma factor (sigma-70 family)